MAHLNKSRLSALVFSMLLLAPLISIEVVKGVNEASKLPLKLPSFLLAPLRKAETNVPATNFRYDDSDIYDRGAKTEKSKKESATIQDPAAAFLEQKILNIELKKQIEELKKENSKTLKDLQDQNAKLTTELNGIKESLKATDSLKDQVKALEEKNKGLAEEIKEGQKTVAEKDEQLKSANKTIDELKDKIVGFFKKFDDLLGQIKDFKLVSQEYDRLKKENAELKSQKSQGDCRKVEEELQKSRKQIEGLTSEIEELKKKLTAPAGDVSGLQKQLKDLERSYVECRRNLNLLMIEDRKRNKDSVETSKVIVSNIEIVPKEGSNKQGFIVGATAN